MKGKTFDKTKDKDKNIVEAEIIEDKDKTDDT